MKTLTIATVLVSLAAGSIACGSKSKKPVAATDTSTTGSSDREATGPDAPVKTSTDDGAAPASAALENVIYFEFDSSSLSPDARKSLEENAEWLKQDATRKLTIEGHTDEVGTTEYNVALGERRARAAFDYLKMLGVDEARVDVVSFGEEKPAGDDAQNRRAMFIATKPR